MKRFLLLLALVVVPVAAADQLGPNDWGPLPVKSGVTGVSRIEPRFSRAAALVSGGKTVEIRCWSVPDWQRLREEWIALGVTGFYVAYRNNNDPVDSPRIHVSPTLCASLAKIAYRNGWRTTSRKVDLAIAVVTLAHEAQHLRGVADEPTAECYGLQRARMVARSLGMTLSESDRLVATYWQFAYRKNPPGYRSAECRQGGDLDLNVKPVFP